MKKISVVGAGFAGLSLALRLAERGFQVDLYEKSDRLGGLIGTERTPWGLAERAANALIRTDAANQLFEDLKVPLSLPKKESRRRFIFRGRPRTWPLSFQETLCLIKKVLPKAFAFQKELSPVANETLEDWGLRHLGQAPSQFLLGPAMQGIYATELSNLSSSLILGPLFSKNRKRSKYHGLLSGPGGLQDLVDALGKALHEKGVRIHLNHEVNLQNLQGPVVLAVSASAAALLTASVNADLSYKLREVRMGSIMSVKVFFSETQKNYEGFGCLIPRGLGLDSLGVLMNSTIFSGRDQHYNETWIMGGEKINSLIEMSDDALLEKIQHERQQILGRQDTILGSRIHRWQNALPVYDIALEKIQKQLTQDFGDLYLHGNYVAGMGLSKILERSNSLAEELTHKYG